MERKSWGGGSHYQCVWVLFVMTYQCVWVLFLVNNNGHINVFGFFSVTNNNDYINVFVFFFGD